MDFAKEKILDQFQEVDPYEFEQFVAKLWELQNWDAYVTRRADDGGIDVIAEQSTLFDKKVLIQVKRYKPSNSVTRSDIQQYASLRQEKTDVDAVIVLTTGGFTDGAEDVAEKLNVKLIDGSQLYNLIDALDAFDLARSYIDAKVIRENTVHKDTEGDTNDTSSKHQSGENGPESTTGFTKDADVGDIPISLSNIIRLRESIANSMQKINSEVDAAADAFHEKRYFDAVEQYKDLNKHRLALQRKVALYDTGLTHIDRQTAKHLPDPGKFSEELSQITDDVDTKSQEVARIAKRVKGLNTLTTEIGNRVQAIESTIDTGDQLHRSGNFTAAESKYKRAQHSLAEVDEPMKIYQDLISEYDDEIIESHDEFTQDFSLSGLETKIKSRVDTAHEPLEIHTVAENAIGSFNPELLTENDGELFDNELIEYLGEDEKLEFVFEPPRMGFTIIASGETRERPQHDAQESGTSFLLITDQRILYVAGVDDHDVERSLKYDQIIDVVISSESNPRYIQFTDVEGTKYKFAALRNHPEDIEPAAAYLTDKVK